MYKDKKVVIVGGSGFIGTQLAKELLKRDAYVIIVDLNPSPLKEVSFVQSDFKIFPNVPELKNPFVIFNLAGASIFGRWTRSYKELIYTSRINTTKTLVEQFEHVENRPEFLVSTSAIGIYGDRESEILNEDSKLESNTYLARLARDWEQKAFKAKEFGVQVRIIRNAHVLGQGGILGVLKKIFSLGLGGIIGAGDQYMSFVSISACVRFYLDAPFSEHEIQNAVTIRPLTNTDFSHVLARILRRPLWFRIPVWALQIVYGDFAKEIISSQRVISLHKPILEDAEEVIVSILKK